MRNIKTRRIIILDDDQYAIWLRNCRVLWLAIESAAMEFVKGISETNMSRHQEIGHRIDALMFFLDGRYTAMLDYCGFETSMLPNIKLKKNEYLDVERRVGGMASLLLIRNKDQDIAHGDPREVIRRAYKLGLLDDERLWDLFDGRERRREWSKLDFNSTVQERIQ